MFTPTTHSQFLSLSPILQMECSILVNISCQVVRIVEIGLYGNVV